MKQENIEKLIKLYLEGARKFYPELGISSFFSTSNGEEQHTSANIELNNKVVDISFRDCYEVIHYTSLNSFIEIINSQSIRMYNCNNLNDSFEIENGLKSLNFEYEQEILQQWKRQHFILSTPRYNRKTNDDFNMWRLYGHNGMGVGLIFEVPKEIKDWIGVSIKEVEYSSNNPTSKTKQFLDFHNNFQKKHRLFNNFPSVIPHLASFYKNEIWSIENETRIVSSCPYNEYSLECETNVFNYGSPYLQQTLSHSLNSFGKPVAYVELPISKKILENKIHPNCPNEDRDKILSNHPFLQLKGIVVGPQLANSPNVNHLLNFIHKSAEKLIGSNLDIIDSNFKWMYE